MKLRSMCITLMLVPASFGIVSAQNSDTAFIRKNIRDNLHEIRMAELAINKDVNQELKNVAIMIRDDHKAMLNDLLNYAKENNLTSVTESEMNISNDTIGHGSAASGGKGMMNRNRRDDAQSVDESRNTRRKNRQTQAADAGKPSGDKQDPRGTGYDHSREMQANGDSGQAASAGINQPGAGGKESAEGAERKHSAHMGMVQRLNGKEFSDKWTELMISAHKAKLQELQQASQTITAAPLKQQVTAAIPKIQAHLEGLKKFDKGQ